MSVSAAIGASSALVVGCRAGAGSLEASPAGDGAGTVPWSVGRKETQHGGSTTRSLNGLTAHQRIPPPFASPSFSFGVFVFRLHRQRHGGSPPVCRIDATRCCPPKRPATRLPMSANHGRSIRPHAPTTSGARPAAANTQVGCPRASGAEEEAG